MADLAYEQVRDRIVTLDLPTGTVLREDRLMDEPGIGRTPLRDAIKRLSLEGLVNVKPRRETTATDVNGGRHRPHHRGARRARGLRGRARRPPDVARPAR